MDPTINLHVRARPAGDYTIVAVSGELDVANAYALRECLLDVLRHNGSRLVLDLSAVSFCDASGLATLVATRRRADLLGGTLRLAGPQPQVLKILRITGLHRHLATFPTTAAACMPLAAADRPDPARAVRDANARPAGDGTSPRSWRRIRHPRTNQPGQGRQPLPVHSPSVDPAPPKAHLT